MYSLKAARVNAKLTQEDVGKLLGVERSTVSAWENGRSVPRYDMCTRISKLYDIPMSEIKFF